MTTQTFDAQTINEDDLEAVQGGGFLKDFVNGVFDFTPAGPMNRTMQQVPGGSIGDYVVS